MLLTAARVREWKASALAGLRPKFRVQVSRGDIVSSGKGAAVGVLDLLVSRELYGAPSDVARPPLRCLTGRRGGRRGGSVFVLVAALCDFQVASALPRVDVEEAWGKARPAIHCQAGRQARPDGDTQQGWTSYWQWVRTGWPWAVHLVFGLAATLRFLSPALLSTETRP